MKFKMDKPDAWLDGLTRWLEQKLARILFGSAFQKASKRWKKKKKDHSPAPFLCTYTQQTS